jgi:hypothetical protein
VVGDLPAVGAVLPPLVTPYRRPHTIGFRATGSDDRGAVPAEAPPLGC